MFVREARRDEQKAKGQGLVVVEAAQAMAGRRSRPLICLRSMYGTVLYVVCKVE